MPPDRLVDANGRPIPIHPNRLSLSVSGGKLTGRYTRGNLGIIRNEQTRNAPGRAATPDDDVPESGSNPLDPQPRCYWRLQVAIKSQPMPNAPTVDDLEGHYSA